MGPEGDTGSKEGSDTESVLKVEPRGWAGQDCEWGGRETEGLRKTPEQKRMSTAEMEKLGQKEAPNMVLRGRSSHFPSLSFIHTPALFIYSSCLQPVIR